MNDQIFPELQSKEFKSQWYDGFHWEDQNHEKIIDSYRVADLYSLILFTKNMNEQTYENPEKVRKIPQTLVPKIFQHMDGHHGYPGPSAKEWLFVEKVIEQHYPGLRESDPKKFHKEFDFYIESYLQSFLPLAERELMEEWAYEKWLEDNDFEDDDEDKEWDECLIEMQEKYPDEYESARKKLYLPEYTYDYIRRFEIFPKPISMAATDRSYVTQFFMADFGTFINCGTGRGSGSGTRFNHGIYAHLFAALTKEGRPCRTIICQLDENMDLKVIRDENKFILYGHHLTGNYPIDHDKSKQIMEGIEMIYDFETNERSLT